MGDGSTDDSSDEFYSSYKTAAKRAYEEALKRAAEATVDSVDLILSDSSGSDDCSPVKTKRLKRKRANENVRITRSRKKELSADASTIPSSKKPELDYDMLSSDSDTSFDMIDKVNKCPSPPKTNVTKGNSIRMNDDELDYDTEPEVKSVKEIVTISDSSSLEELSSPNISRRRVERDSNELMSIKISWRFQAIQKFQLRRHQKFKTLLEHFAKIEGVPIEQIVIHGGKDSWRSIEPYDTPDSIGITITDVLEGGVLSSGLLKNSSLTKRYRDPSEADEDEIEVRVQQEQTRSFPLLIKRHQKMKVLFIKVAEQLEIELDKVKLLLDGEVIAPDSTPKDLDLDDGDVLDMVMA